MQGHGEGLQPLEFVSRKLKPSEQNILHMNVNWQQLHTVSSTGDIEGCPGSFTVVTDHKPLTNLMDQQQFTRTQMRWVRLGLFQSINPIIKYQPGKANVIADALSRSINMVIGGSSIQSAGINQWCQALKEDPVLREQIQHIKDGQSSKYQLSSSGSLYREHTDRQQILVPQVLRQQVI